jgi:hypothetical protein
MTFLASACGPDDHITTRKAEPLWANQQTGGLFRFKFTKFSLLRMSLRSNAAGVQLYQEDSFAPSSCKFRAPRQRWQFWNCLRAKAQATS